MPHSGWHSPVTFLEFHPAACGRPRRGVPGRRCPQEESREEMSPNFEFRGRANPADFRSSGFNSRRSWGGYAISRWSKGQVATKKAKTRLWTDIKTQYRQLLLLYSFLGDRTNVLYQFISETFRYEFAAYSVVCKGWRSCKSTTKRLPTSKILKSNNWVIIKEKLQQRTGQQKFPVPSKTESFSCYIAFEYVSTTSKRRLDQL